MRCDRAIEQQRILRLARIAHNAVVADDHIFTDIGVVANITIATDDGRPFDHHAILDNGSLTDEDFFANISHAIATVMKPGAQMGKDIRLNPLQRFPRVFAPVKDRHVLRLAQIKQIRRFEHGIRLGIIWQR